MADRRRPRRPGPGPLGRARVDGWGQPLRLRYILSAPAGTPHNDSPRRWTLLRRAVLALLVLELASYAIIFLSRPFVVAPVRRPAGLFADHAAAIHRFLSGDRGIWAFDSLLGWRRPADLEDSLRTSNSRGLLGRREYDPVPARGITRIAAFGNSFVAGADVAVDSTWLSQLERADPRFEVLNYGIAAYGTDQSLLQYLSEGRPMHPRVVLIGLAADNLNRNINVYRRFFTPQGPPLTKPRFLLDGGQLRLLPNPLHAVADLERYAGDRAATLALGRYDAWYEPALWDNPGANWSAAIRLATTLSVRVRRRYFDPDALYRGTTLNATSSGFRLAVALLGAFADSAQRDGAMPLVVVLPSRESYRGSLNGKPGELAPVVDSLRARGIDVVDVTDALLVDSLRSELDRLYTRGHHYTPYAGGVIARWLAPEIARRVP